MRKYLTLLTISVLLFCSAQCSREETPAPNNGGIQPEWEVRIPTKKSPYIYWEGLNYIYKYGDCIIAHTSFYGDSENEDNRLCGINEKTKEIEWFFPSDTSKRYDYIFRSKAYQYKNMLFFKYSDNDYSESAKAYNVCFDLSSKKVIWEKESSARDAEIIEGFDNTCYFSTNGHEVNRISLDNLSVEKIFDSDSTKVSDFKISTNKQHIIISHYKDVRIEGTDFDYYEKSYVTIMDLRNGDIVLNRDVTPYNRYSSKYSPSLFERNGILYVNINTYILALSIRENKIIWETDNSEMYVLQDLHIYNNKLIKCAISATCEYDTANGKLLSLSDYQGSSFSTLYGKYLFIIDRKLRLLILDLDSGRIVNSILCKYSDAGENFFGSYPTIIDDKLYIMSTNALYRYNLSDLLN